MWSATLDPEDILITDSSGPISLAGTMGGVETEVSESSRDLVIEAAHFSARGVARMSRRHKLASEASARFERGVDPELQLRASARAAAMLAALGGGTEVPGCSFASVETEPVTILMAADYPDQVAGWCTGSTRCCPGSVRWAARLCRPVTKCRPMPPLLLNRTGQRAHR